MHELSMNQIAYINREKRKKKLITASRILILIVFFLLWEVCADTGLIDSFIFSSPSRLLDCFFTMLKNQNLLFHIGITLFETMLSFVLVIFFTLFVTILLWQSSVAESSGSRMDGSWSKKGKTSVLPFKNCLEKQA